MAISNHWYDWQGLPQHFIACKTREGTRPSTIADARKNGWLPSVTGVLKCMDKPALTQWLINNAVLAVMTTPRKDNEPLEVFVQRALAHDAEQEAKQARDLGSDIHKAIEEHLAGRLYAPQFKPFVEGAIKQIAPLGKVTASEQVLVHPLGFAGRMDARIDGQGMITVFDFKTSKKLPDKGAWPEALVQTAAYAAALGNTGDNRVQTGVLYISTVTPGETRLFVTQDWAEHWRVFQAVFEVWKFLNNYNPARLQAPNPDTNPDGSPKDIIP